MNFFKRLFGGAPAKSITPSAEPTKPMAPAAKAPAAAPAAQIPADDMTLIDPVAKDTWRADQWRAGSKSSDYDKKK